MGKPALREQRNNVKWLCDQQTSEGKEIRMSMSDKEVYL